MLLDAAGCRWLPLMASADGCSWVLVFAAGCCWLLLAAVCCRLAAASCRWLLPIADCWQLLTAASCYWLLPLATAGSQQKSAAGTNRGSSGQLVIESAKQLKAERQQGEQGQHETTVPAGVARSTRGSRQQGHQAPNLRSLQQRQTAAASCPSSCLGPAASLLMLLCGPKAACSFHSVQWMISDCQTLPFCF